MIFEKQIVNMYKGMMHTRCDDTETVFYFTPEDFPGLQASPCTFRSSKGHELKGYFYSYENPTEGRIVVFDHGFGGGHRAYMKEIEKLASHGYRVFSYDHTGCMESGGETPGGLSQSLCDLNDCISMLKEDPSFRDADISVVGHSWGAFSTLNIAALHKDVSRIVAISGFVSVTEMVGTFFGGLLSGYRRAILDVEREANPDFVGYDAVKTLSAAKTRALLIYSENDAMCKIKHCNILREGLSGCKNVEFLIEKRKGHNPNYTEDAVGYLGKFVAARAKLLRKKALGAEEKRAFVSSFDFSSMTEQDESVWQKIFEHLDR